MNRTQILPSQSFRVLQETENQQAIAVRGAPVITGGAEWGLYLILRSAKASKEVPSRLRTEVPVKISWKGNEELKGIPQEKGTAKANAQSQHGVWGQTQRSLGEGVPRWCHGVVCPGRWCRGLRPEAFPEPGHKKPPVPLHTDWILIFFQSVDSTIWLISGQMSVGHLPNGRWWS